MASASIIAPRKKTLQDAELKERLQFLRQSDNLTNWLFVARAYIYLFLVIGGAVWFDLHRQAAVWSFWWNVPVGIVAIILIGAGQHQLSGLAHEGVHHILFRTRYLNELASDLLCLFPLYSSTHHYRLQHLAHHQFINDPVRDPDISQLQTSGHWLPFPMGKGAFLLQLVKQLWLPNLFRFMIIRAKYNATGTDKNPYMRKDVKPSRLPVRIGILYLFSQVAVLAGLVWHGDPLLLAIVPPAMWLAAMITYILMPANKFSHSRVHPVIPMRWQTILRVTYITLVFNTLAWVTLVTGVHAWAYYAVYWLVPIFTSFSFFMILRQLVQHGNADRGWLTNTRIFFVSRFINFSVFPIGQDYHLPHHLFATVPHYRLKQLHETLLEYPEYQEEALEVHGYFLSPEHPQSHPTVLDVLGPAYAAHEFHGVHIDNTVLEDDEVEEKEAILREGEAEAQRLAALNQSTRPAAQR